jgi:hypothetical protein
MTVSKYLMAVALVSLAACTPTGGGGGGTSAPTAASLPGGLAPSPGRTAAERQSSKNYYRGPRGSEF